MWKIISFLLPWFIAIIVITQVILPLLLKRKLFWIFRKKIINTDPKRTLEEEIQLAENAVRQAEKTVTGVKNKINKNYDEAEKLKKKSDFI